MKKIITLILAAFFLQTFNANAEITEWKESQGKGAKTRLLASFYQDKNGEKKLITGLQFKMGSGWKIYGNGSEGIGLPPSFSFEGSSNYLKHQIFWPEAKAEEEKIGNESIKYFVYKDEVVIPIAIDLQDSTQATELTLKLDYGLCKDICIPASESFSLKISDKIDEEALTQIKKFYPSLPVKDAPQTTNNHQPTTKIFAFISIIFLAIFGGAILNVMPCVLPVSSIKLISVIKHSNAELSRIRFAFFSTILGIIFCFVIFAALAGTIKITSNSLGWGLQFQNPYFLIFLVVILVFFIANLLGFFEFTFERFLATILHKKIQQEEEGRNIFVPNFLSGILAVLLATPCSAPFLGSAISFALVQNFLTILLTFFFIGIGFAAPYIALMISPQLVNRLPKPGMWMVRIKQLMAGFLMATVMWLVYVLSHNIGNFPAGLVIVLSLALFTCFKIRFQILKYIATIAVLISIFSLPLDAQNKRHAVEHEADAIWRNFDEMEIYREVAKGNIVIVDITADWCLTCKFNKVRVLQDKEIMAKLKGGNTIAMRGDITKPDEEIMNFLHKNNRFAIPFNAVYGPGAKTGIVTSELLTKKELLESIKKAEDK